MLGEKIKSLRLEKGLSQEGLAKELSVVRQTVSKWEKGLSLPDSKMLMEIAAALGTTVSDLLDENTAEQEIPLRNAKEKNNTFIIILIILGLPIWLPLLLSAFAIGISIYASVWAIIISFWAVFGSFAATALAGIIVGTSFALTGQAAVGIAVIGAALILAGLSIFTFYGCTSATKYLVIFTKKVALRLCELIARKGARNV